MFIPLRDLGRMYCTRAFFPDEGDALVRCCAPCSLLASCIAAHEADLTAKRSVCKWLGRARKVSIKRPADERMMVVRQT